ncbi:MAG: homocysteine S-methyltransferase family protein, partial [Chloroflexota bacterium]|nr:homocysteine S-methyltransferase family protein [Chloroflexota bacterium]
DYLEVWQDSLVDNEDSTAGLTQEADIWVEMGAQVIGTCCGFGVDYIKALSGALPERVSSPRRFA